MNMILGALVWVIFVLLPWDVNRGIGTIEKLFLLGPLVVVPLGTRMKDECAGMKWMMLGAAVGVVVSFLAPVGMNAGILTVPWLAVCAWVALPGVNRLREPVGFCRSAAGVGLMVGAVGLLQSRWGMQPLGFQEPWVLLVAVHFHFAAFVTPLMAGEVMQRMKRGRWALALGACLGSPLLAGGYVLHLPALRLTGAGLLVVTLVAVAGWSLWNLRRIKPVAARVLIGVSSGAGVVAMGLAAVYAVADFFGEVWIAVPQMARTHGVLQAVGFSVCGLWGWRLAQRKWGLGSLTRRWR